MEKSQKMSVAMMKRTELLIELEQLVREAKEYDLKRLPKLPVEMTKIPIGRQQFGIFKCEEEECDLKWLESLEMLPPLLKQKISDKRHMYKLLEEAKHLCENCLFFPWMISAYCEASQKQIQYERPFYEQKLQMEYQKIPLWLKYMELLLHISYPDDPSLPSYASRFIFRNNCSSMLQPWINNFWYRYTFVEETLGNIAGARHVFEQWMNWEPYEPAWQEYIKFELRNKEIDRARQIYERFVMVRPDAKHWIKYAHFEESHGFIKRARAVYQQAVNIYGVELQGEKVFLAFARFEEGQREHDRARIIYKYALQHLSKDRTKKIYKAYTIHEKKYGDRLGIKYMIVSKLKHQYEQEIKESPSNYYAWFNYLRLVVSEDNVDVICETYERAIANVPPTKKKQFWRRYVHLWIKYAPFEKLIPHECFTFSKIWLLYACFEIRQKNFTKARKPLALALGICPTDKLYRGCIEVQLVLFDRCRELYEKFVELRPESCTTLMRTTELETRLGKIDRARTIYEFAIVRSRSNMPELLWKSHIDFEIAQGETDNARQLFERLLERTQSSSC